MATEEDIQRLIVLLEARSASFEKAMAKAVATTNKRSKEIETRLGTMQARVSSTFAAIGRGAGLLGISVAASAIIGRFKEIVEASDDMVDASERLGIPIEKLQDLRHIAEQEGLDFKAMTGGLDKFSQNLVEATTKGNDLAKTLELNGISMDRVAASLDDPVAMLEEVAELIRRAGSEAEAEVISVQAFGRAAGPEMAAALRKGKKGMADAAAAVDKIGRLTPEQEQKLAAANKKIEAFQKTLGYYTAVAAAAGIDALDKFIAHVDGPLTTSLENFINNPSVDTFLDMLLGKEGSPILVDGKPIGGINFKELISPSDETRINNVKSDIASVYKWLKELSDQPVTVEVQAQTRWALARLAELQSKLAQLEEGATIPVSMFAPASPDTPMTRYRTSSVTTTRTTTTKPPEVTLDPDSPVTVSPDTEFVKQLELLQAGGGARYGPEIDPAYLDERALVGPDFEFAVGSTSAPTTTLETPVSDATTDAIEQVETETRLYTEEMEEAAAAAEQQAEKIAEVTENLQFERDQLGRTAREQEIYNQLKAAGVDINSAAGQEIAKLAGLLYDETRALEMVVENMDLLRESAKDMTQTLIQGLIEGRDATEVLGEALGRLADRLLSSGIDQLFNILLGMPGTPGFLGSIFGRATGGSIDPGQVYKVHKDELIIPRRPGTVIPAGAAKRSGGEGGLALSYAPSIVIQGNADENAIRIMRDRIMVDIQESLPKMVKKSNANRRL